ncbi:SDR family oxidoreductase [Raineyella sp. LH-20]|uniref:SDR family oxidoreductase n=1 Tax=Raineyella sp. LH-20 TaxID=3081204 RepID=UPI002953631C|nr:SDR family oxidoreductase [Raineyella sp. LH-20]WOP19139.1 SDR family oxidoreductase [Raineyella sp. LH-20]
MATIVIIGGHGKVALRLAPLLVAQGHRVRSWVRHEDQLDDIRASGAEAVLADAEAMDVEAMATALTGADAVVWSAGAGGGNPSRTYAVDRDAAIRSMQAAEQAGVRRYVMVSWAGSVPDLGVPADSSFFPYADAKLAADDHLRTTSLDWTILGPGTLTLDEPTGRIDTGVGSGRPTSRANVALAVREALAQPATIGRFIPFADGGTPIAEAFAAL